MSNINKIITLKEHKAAILEAFIDSCEAIRKAVAEIDSAIDLLESRRDHAISEAFDYAFGVQADEIDQFEVDRSRLGEDIRPSEPADFSDWSLL